MCNVFSGPVLPPQRCAHESGYRALFSVPLHRNPLWIPGLRPIPVSHINHTSERGKRSQPTIVLTWCVDLISRRMLETEFSTSLCRRSALALNTIVMDSWRTHARHSRATKAETCYRNLDFLVDLSFSPHPFPPSLLKRKLIAFKAEAPCRNTTKPLGVFKFPPKTDKVVLFQRQAHRAQLSIINLATTTRTTPPIVPPLCFRFFSLPQKCAYLAPPCIVVLCSAG